MPPDRNRLARLYLAYKEGVRTIYLLNATEDEVEFYPRPKGYYASLLKVESTSRIYTPHILFFLTISANKQLDSQNRVYIKTPK